MFTFKEFTVDDSGCAMKVGTDSVLLGAWADVHGAINIMDIGSGSGVLSLIMAQRTDDAIITGVELDPVAADCAMRNFQASPWRTRLSCVCADANEYSNRCVADKMPDLIICNPPFFAENVLSPDRLRSQARHSGHSLSPESVVSIASRLLSADGSLAMVTPASYADSLLFAAEMSRLSLWRQCFVSTVRGKRPSRILWQFARRSRGATVRENISIRQSDNHTYTPEYIAMTRDLYLQF